MEELGQVRSGQTRPDLNQTQTGYLKSSLLQCVVEQLGILRDILTMQRYGLRLLGIVEGRLCFWGLTVLVETQGSKPGKSQETRTSHPGRKVKSEGQSRGQKYTPEVLSTSSKYSANLSGNVAHRTAHQRQRQYCTVPYRPTLSDEECA